MPKNSVHNKNPGSSSLSTYPSSPSTRPVRPPVLSFRPTCPSKLCTSRDFLSKSSAQWHVDFNAVVFFVVVFLVVVVVVVSV